MGVFTCKFGGSSVASAAQIQKCCSIIAADSRRRFIVPSAPGKRSRDDIKVTDLLYQCHQAAQKGQDFMPIFAQVRQRFDEIIQQLGLSLDLSADYRQIEQALSKQTTADYIASRGEFLNGRIIAAVLGLPFVDAADIVRFDSSRRFDAQTTQQLASAALGQLPGAVVPGFYGSAPDGSIVTFSRGGADVSGSIVARAVQAEVYENWTDVSGFLMADPRIVDQPVGIDVITYRELRELSYMGATVLHEDAIFPVRQAGIPINVRNTNAPQDPGTWIVSKLADGKPSRRVTGIAGRQGYTVITLDKEMMNNETGFGRRMLSVVEEQNIPFEHMPTGIDNLSLVIAGQHLANGKLQTVLDRLQQDCKPDNIMVEENIALIATVGLGMGRIPGISGQLFGALGRAGINVRMIAQGSSEINIIIGVSDEDFTAAIQAIYNEFCQG